MKKIIFFILLGMTPMLTTAQDSAKVEQIQVPDSLCVVIEAERICFPTQEAQAATEEVKRFIEENDGNWPTTFMGWAVLILGTVLGGRYTALRSNATKIYYFLRTFLKETLHVVAFIAGVIAAGLTFLVGLLTKDTFSWQVFGMVWPWTALVSIYVYEKWIKKKDAPVQDLSKS